MAAAGEPGLLQGQEEAEAAVVVVGSCMTDLVRSVGGSNLSGLQGTRGAGSPDDGLHTPFPPFSPPKDAKV